MALYAYLMDEGSKPLSNLPESGRAGVSIGTWSFLASILELLVVVPNCLLG